MDSESGAVVVAESLASIHHQTFQLKILAVDHGVPARYELALVRPHPVSYTHLTLPTNREV